VCFLRLDGVRAVGGGDHDIPEALQRQVVIRRNPVSSNPQQDGFTGAVLPGRCKASGMS